MERPPVITMTNAAADRVRALMDKGEDSVLGLRVTVATKGCSGLSYVFEYATDKKPADEEVEVDGARVFVDPFAVMYIMGSEMDYQEDKLQSGFTFTNPNEKSRCGCGESFSV